MRINITGGSNTLYYILKDHLGSASIVTDSTGTIVSGSEQRYHPYGESRLTGTMLTDKLYTGQRDVGLGIYHYGARFRVAPPKRSGVGYSPKLGRFLSADTIVPGTANPQAYNRYSYVLGNPLKYIDPTGHYCVGDDEDCADEAGDGPAPTGTGGNNGNGGGGGGHRSDDIPDPNPRGVGGYSGSVSTLTTVPSDSCSGCPIVSSVPSGPSCTYTTYCYAPPELLEPIPWFPDYLAIEVGVPSQLWIFGADFVLTIDKYNRIYFGAGPSAGTSPFFGLDANASVSVGYINDDNTTPGEAHSFITEWSGGGCIGAVVGYCRVTGDPFDGANTWVNQYGVFTPQAGAAMPYSVQIYPLPR